MIRNNLSVLHPVAHVDVNYSFATRELDSFEIQSRGTVWGLVSGLFTAIPSGVGVALAITGGGINALVGVAISASILPPIVNCGLCISLAAWYTGKH